MPAAAGLLPGRLPGDGWPIAAAAGIVGLVTIAGWLGTWVLSGRAWPAYVALALVPVWLMTDIAGTPLGSLSRESAATFSSLLPPFVALAMTYRAGRSPEVDTALRPLQKFGFLVVATAIVIALAALAGQHAFDAPPVAVAAGGFIAALTWGAVAAVLWRARGLALRDRGGLMVAMCAFGVAALDRTVGRLDPDDAVASWAFSGARSVVLVGWLLLFVVAARSTVRARRTFNVRQHQLRAARDAIADGFAEHRKRIEERRHDIRSMVSGIQGASTTLARYRAFLDVGEQRDLEAALLAEIDRLQHSISAAPIRLEPFGLRGAVVPVITAERARGTVVNADLPDLDVLGSADATAALVQNLVTNARRHAPGATVTVAAQASGCDVVLVVSDDGPGLPTPLRERVASLFAAGRIPQARELIPRQSTAEGGGLEPIHDRHGLGLAICARLAREQGGRLRLAKSTVGTRIELSLRLAASEPVCDLP